MRILISIATVLATASVASAQLGGVTGTVQDTTRVQTEELELDSTGRIGSNLQTGPATSRIEQMRQRRALREARRAAQEARDSAERANATPQASTIVDTGASATAGIDESTSAAVANQSSATGTTEQVAARSRTSGEASLLDQADTLIVQELEVAAEPEAPTTGSTGRSAINRVETEVNRTEASINAELPQSSVQVSSPQAVVVSQGSGTRYVGAANRTQTVIVRDRRQAAVQQTEAGTATTSGATGRATPVNTATASGSRNWVSMGSVQENAFPLCVALFLIAALLSAASLLSRRRQA